MAAEAIDFSVKTSRLSAMSASHTSPGSSPQLPSSTSSPCADAIPSPTAPTAAAFPSLHQFDLSAALAMMRSPGGFNLMPQSHSFASPIGTFPNLAHAASLGFGSVPEMGFSPTTSIALSTLNKRRRLSRPISPAKSTAGSLSPASPQRKLAEAIPEEKKDSAYWERRRKNNDAAKRSRDIRRQKEEQIAMRAAFLEQENLKLKAQVAVLKNETAKLHLMMFSNAHRNLHDGFKSSVAH
uniref:BZIP domain-containing protein n=1 Tax=Plectus sambesii TaxID=2011161 RepID=A0A914X9U9_9BILA